MSGPTMNIGTPAQDAVGTSGDAVGNPGSTFFNAVMGTVFLNTVVNLVQEMSGDRPMTPGMGFGEVLGPRADVYGLMGSTLALGTLASMAEDGVTAMLYGKNGAPSLGGGAPQANNVGTDNTVQQPTQTQPVVRNPVNKGPGM